MFEDFQLDRVDVGEVTLRVRCRRNLHMTTSRLSGPPVARGNLN
jgi:hypothetical protein